MPNEQDNLKSIIQININSFDFYRKKELLYKNRMKEEKYFLNRDSIVKINDVNVDFLKNLDYNKIKKRSLEYLLYIFVCEDKEIRAKLYEGDEMMERVSNKLDELISVFDISYDHDEFEDRVAFELGEERGIKKEKRNMAKKMIALNSISVEQISKITELSKKEISKLKNEL